MQTRVDEIEDGIFRLSTFLPQVGPDGFTMNQFLPDAEEPLLYHTGTKGLLPLVAEAVEQVVPLDRLRWIPAVPATLRRLAALEPLRALADAYEQAFPTTRLAPAEAGASA